MEEVWKDVVGFEGLYQVSNYGRVFSVRNNRVINQGCNNRGQGYYHVRLHNGKCHTKTVHRLVAEAFIPNPNGYPQVNHIDENAKNNRVDNLEWCTSKYNNNYGTRNARISASERKNPNKNRIPVAQYTLDGKLVRTYSSIAEVGRCGFTKSHVLDCARGSSRYSHSQGYVWKFIEGCDL